LQWVAVGCSGSQWTAVRTWSFFWEDVWHCRKNTRRCARRSARLIQFLPVSGRCIFLIVYGSFEIIYGSIEMICRSFQSTLFSENKELLWDNIRLFWKNIGLFLGRDVRLFRKNVRHTQTHTTHTYTYTHTHIHTYAHANTYTHLPVPGRAALKNIWGRVLVEHDSLLPPGVKYVWRDKYVIYVWRDSSHMRDVTHLICVTRLEGRHVR